jgi:hypothetical protein
LEGQLLNKKTFFVIFSLLSISAFIIGCSQDNSGNNTAIVTPALLLPADEEISGWVNFGSYEEANNFDSLYEIIGGVAQVYIDNGFVSGVFQQYISSAGGNTVTLRIYDQGNDANASITFDKVGVGIPLNDVGREARINETTLASYTIEFWQRNFFIQVVIDQKTDEALNTAELFASYLSRNIG